MTSRERVVQLLRALSAAIALGALVVGPPILLARAVGWPLPSKLPTVDQLRDALGGSTIADGTILKALALVCWGAWLQIAISAVVEIHAWVTGTVSSRIPFGGFVQPIVRQLVVSGALFFAAVRSAQPVGPALTTATPAVAVLPAPASPSNVMLTPDARVIASAATPASTITVQPRDSLWRVAERHLGDGMRWRELWDLNRGRSFPDGRTFSNPNLIQPGWALTCPPDAIDIDRPSVEAGAEQAPEPSGAPATTVDPTVTTTPAAPSVAPSTVVARPSNAGDSPSASADQSHDARDLRAVELITGSLLAAGFVAMLDRLRRIQLRRREAGRAPRPPDEKTVETETRLRLSALEAHAERLDLALRALAACLAQSKSASVPEIELVSVGPHAVEIVLTADPDATSGPFQVSPDGRAWTLASESSLDEITALAAGQAAPSPALVSIGVVDERQVLVDLESLPHLLVTGDPAVGRRLIWSAAVEMSTSPWVDDLELIVVTERPTPLGELDRVTVLASVDEALARIQSTVADTKRDLGQSSTRSTLASRVRNPADPWTPLAILVPDVLDGQSLRRIVEAVPPNAGACILAASPDSLDSAHVLRVDQRGATLLPVNLRLGLGCWPDEVATDAEALLSYALDRGNEVDLLDEIGTVTPPATYVPRSPFAPEADGVLVCVLGAVEVRGAERAIDRRRSLELVTYLSLHPDGIDEARLRCVLWPDGDPSRENFNQTVSRARQPLGHAADGSLHFPRLVDDGVALYRLGCSVTTDAALLEDALRAAIREPSDTSLEHLASMLSLIRGLPFEGTKGGWEWTFTEGHAARLAALAAEAAHAVAKWSIDHGEVQRALWAASQGLRAAPGDEVLYRDRMQAHDRAGNLGGVESVMKELREIVDDGEPYDAIHPDTVAYYEELTGRVRRIG